jgi:3-oxosteroid 1-dehydrogenase
MTDTASTGTETGSWDHQVDLLVVGSGAGAMTAAIVACDRGADTLLIEKSSQYGGSSAMSGGSLWIPNNHLMLGAQVNDTRADALAYLTSATAGRVPGAKLEAYVDAAPEMLRYLTDRTHLRCQALPHYCDYYPTLPGSKPGARSIEADTFDGRLLGEEVLQLREPSVQTLIMGRVSMTAAEARVLLVRSRGWIALTLRLMLRYALDLRWRLRSKRDRALTMGNALVGRLRLSLRDRGIPLWLETPARELVLEDGRVVGVVAERNGRRVRIRARHGVILAAGGFEGSQALREKYLPNPTRAEWSAANPQNTGDALLMGLAVGAATDFLDDAWWGPTTVVPGESRARMLVIEKSLPGSILVNQAGARFVNEAAPYIDVVRAMYEKHASGTGSVPAYLVFDGRFRRSYPFGPFLQSSQQPDRLISSYIDSGYLRRSDTLRGLAEQLGVDADGLEATVRKVNEYARTGVDLDFRRGDNLFDRYYGDQNIGPNPCLAPLQKPPFYGIEAYAGDLGTKGGLCTDERARVLRESGEVIPGLYAVGNCSAALMGPTYAGAGATLGPAMTFGYLAARDATPDR